MSRNIYGSSDLFELPSGLSTLTILLGIEFNVSYSIMTISHDEAVLSIS